jgi:hypothetical protein
VEGLARPQQHGWRCVLPHWVYLLLPVLRQPLDLQCHLGLALYYRIFYLRALRPQLVHPLRLSGLENVLDHPHEHPQCLQLFLLPHRLSLFSASGQPGRLRHEPLCDWVSDDHGCSDLEILSEIQIAWTDLEGNIQG